MPDAWDQFPDAQQAQQSPAGDPWAEFPDAQQAAPQADNPAQYGGAGGYNPMLGRLGMASKDVGRELGITEQNANSPLNVLGPLETGAQLVSGAGATVLGGIAGLAQGAWNSVVPKRFEGQQAGDAVREVQDKLTYQPRTGLGAGMSRVAGLPAELYGAGTDRLGEGAAKLTGSPAVGAALKTGLDIAPALLTRGRTGETPAPRQVGKYTPKTEPAVPTTAELTAASKRAYEAGKESGVIVQAESYESALGKVRQMAKEEGINSKLHPKSSAVMEVLEESRGKPLTLQEAETLRKIALDAEDDLNPVTRQPTPDARIAGKIVDELDENIEALSTNNEARALWARSRKSQMIDQLINRAEIKAGAHYTQAGMEHALRQEFKTLALNPRRMRGLTTEQKVAIVKVAKGGPLENTLRAIGKFDPTTGGVAAAASIVTGTGLAPFTGGASMALPVAGFGAKRLATRATTKNVERAREALVGRGLPNAAPQATKQTTTGGAAAAEKPEKPRIRLPATARQSADIEADMTRLAEEVSQLPPDLPANSPRMVLVQIRLQLLQRELAAAEQPKAGSR